MLYNTLICNLDGGDLLSEESKEFINLFGRGFVGIRRCFFVIEMHGFNSQRSGSGKIGYRQGGKFKISSETGHFASGLGRFIDPWGL